MNSASVTGLPGTRRERQLAWVQQAREGSHGGFAKALATAFQLADLDNATKLGFAYPDHFDQLIGRLGDKPV